MKIRVVFSFLLVLSLTMLFADFVAGEAKNGGDPVIKRWTKFEKGKNVRYLSVDGIMVHEKDPAIQPQPKVVTPGNPSCGDKVGTAPSDAIVLFDGSQESFDNWTDKKGQKSKWKLVDGALESVEKAGTIQSIQKFGSCHLHIEWAAPSKVKGKSQKRGNSGVFLMGIYEVQILDSFENITYPDGMAGAIYGCKKPEVNVCRQPGQWQTFDIIFERPVFDEGGNVVKRAKFNVFHNGVLIHYNYEPLFSTNWDGPHSIKDYYVHDDELPLKLQDHGNPVRFRNIWVRPLKD